MTRLCSLAFCAALFAGLTPARADEPAGEKARLPRVLLVGDSISIGYTPGVQELLRGKADVRHPKDNCGSTAAGLKKLDAWLGDAHWDVIHFNWGLHDLKYVGDEKGTIADVGKGRQWVPVGEYEKNLDELARRLEKTGAKLTWATTTPVPEGARGRVKGEEIKYNEAAARVMKAHGIPADDLTAVATASPALQKPRDVHFTAAGSRELARAVARSVEAALAPAEPADLEKR